MNATKGAWKTYPKFKLNHKRSPFLAQIRSSHVHSCVQILKLLLHQVEEMFDVYLYFAASFL